MKKKEQKKLLETALARNPNNREAQEALENLLGKKKHKYSAKPTEVDGITFDSKREAEYYQELKLLERAGEITRIELQPEYILQEPFRKNGKHHRAIKYRADFKVTYADGTTRIIDVKGMKTPEFRIKQKLFEFKYPDLELKIV